jgi:HTH-type transcriptional regulator/antitoxin HipB
MSVRKYLLVYSSPTKYYVRADIIVNNQPTNGKICLYGHEVCMKIKEDSTSAYGKVTTAEDVGRIIRTKRKETSVRQEMAAGMSEVGTKFLSQLESGKETAELGKTLRVLRKLGLNVYIFPRSADPIKG